MFQPLLKVTDSKSNTLFLENYLSAAGSIILGKETELRLTLCCLVARGNLLIEDIPGMGKTTLVKTLAQITGLTFNRIQFTSDLLPSDILGSPVFNSQDRSFTFHPGPIFSQMVLGDELNRATPRTQSALLQALEERKISIDGKTFDLPKPFFFIATQNPRSQIGTFPLPESQLDRFLMRIHLGYPSRTAEAQVLAEAGRESLIEKLKAVFSPESILELQNAVDQVETSPSIITYIQDILEATRTQSHLCGLSTRAGLHLVHAARAWAFIEGRKMVLPEDIKSVAAAVLGHRIAPEGADFARAATLVEQVLSSVPIR